MKQVEYNEADMTHIHAECANCRVRADLHFMIQVRDAAMVADVNKGTHHAYLCSFDCLNIWAHLKRIGTL